MRCPKCKTELEAGSVYCEKCGQEIQIVPDYDPLDELVIGQERPAEKKKPEGKQKTKEEKENPNGSRPDAGKRKAFLRAGLIGAAVLGCLCVFGISYRSITRENDYSYQLKKGMELTEREKYEEAIPFLKRARILQGDLEGADTRAARCLARAYAGIGAGEPAVYYIEEALRTEEAIRGDDYELEAIYLEAIDLMNRTGESGQINALIEDCAYPEIQEKLEPYRIKKPVCDMKEGTYGHYLTLNLSAEYGSIYYTLDGSPPTTESTRYEKPIELLEEGEILLSAVAVNQKGIVSEELVLVYEVDFQTE